MQQRIRILQIVTIAAFIFLLFATAHANELCWQHEQSADSYVLELTGANGFAGQVIQIPVVGQTVNLGVDKYVNDIISIDADITYRIRGVYSGVVGPSSPMIDPGCSGTTMIVPTIPSTGVCGDVSGDRIITARDAMMVLQSAVGTRVLTCN